MGSINKVILIGRLGREPDERVTGGGTRVSNFSLATDQFRAGNGNGPAEKTTEWHRIVAFGKPADYAKGLKKGDYVEIEGELRSTEYDAQVGDGKKKTTVKRRGWEVRASIVRKLAQPESSREENLDAEPVTEDDAA
jgi:single-strand DNA-binding protein